MASNPGLKSRIGEKSAVYEDRVDPARVAAFRAAVSAQPAPNAPATYPTIFRKGEFELMDRFGIQLKQVLHAEQEYVYERGLTAGANLRFVASLVAALEKNGATGSMQFLTFETRIECEEAGAWHLACVGKTVVVIRGGAA